MADTVNPQVIDSINQVQTATLTQGVIKASGAGKAYQSVAQTSAIVIQDAGDYLRNMQMVTATASGVALAQLVATQNPKYVLPIVIAQMVMTNAIANFTAIGTAAGQVLAGFPSGG